MNRTKSTDRWFCIIGIDASGARCVLRPCVEEVYALHYVESYNALAKRGGRSCEAVELTGLPGYLDRQTAKALKAVRAKGGAA